VTQAPPPDRVARGELESLLGAAIDAVHPQRVLPPALARLDSGRGLRMIAIGKAAAAMADVCVAHCSAPFERALVITKAGHAPALEGRAEFEVCEAAHPLPDARGLRAARAALSLASSCPPESTLVVLLSGGASALGALPAAGLSLDDVARTHALLLGCGADIVELNAVRKHLGGLGGGRLAAASRAARTVVFAISDVPGDRPDAIGSGPCSPDPTTWADAWQVIEGYGLVDALPPSVRALLQRGLRGELPETPKPGDPRLGRVDYEIVARNADARHAAVAAARARGRVAVDRGEELAGEARRCAQTLIERLRNAAAPGERAAGRLRFEVAGGETTVTLRGDGRGGRNQELALAAALAGRGLPGWQLLAAGTDGGDGPTDAAGAHADAATVARGREAGVDAADALERNDSYGFFSKEGGLLRTGPTQTNVMDLAFVRVSV